MILFYTPLSLNLAVYRMQLVVDNETLHGKSVIEWQHTGDKPLQILQLKGKYDRLTLTSHNDYEIEQDGDITLIAFKEPLKPGESVCLDLAFTSMLVNSPLCDSDGSVLMPEGEIRQMWYPYLLWDVPIGGHYRVRIDHPEEYFLCVTGALDGDVYIQDNARLFGLLFCRGLEYAEGHSGEVTIKAFYIKGNESAARKLIHTSAAAIAYYTEQMGFYPQRTYSFVPFSDQSTGGCNWATGIGCFHSMHTFNQADENPVWIAAHELGHHYWGEYVLDGDYCGWLWIGLGLLMDEEFFISQGLTTEASWLGAASVIGYQRRGHDTTVWQSQDTLLEADQLGNDYNNVIRHSKSYCVMQMLKQIIGKETLFEVMRCILRDYAGRSLRTMDFWCFCEEKSGMRLDWFYVNCLYSDRIPGYEITSVTRDKKALVAEIRSFSNFRFPVWIQARSADGILQRKQLNRLFDKQQVRFETDLQDVEVLFETERQLLLKTSSDDALLKDIDNVGYEDDGHSLERYHGLKTMQIEENEVRFKLASQLFTGGHYTEAETILLSIRATKRDFYRTSCIWLGMVMDIQGRRELALTYYDEALGNFPDGVQLDFDQLRLTVDRVWLEQRLHEAYTGITKVKL